MARNLMGTDASVRSSITNVPVYSRAACTRLSTRDCEKCAIVAARRLRSGGRHSGVAMATGFPSRDRCCLVTMHRTVEHFYRAGTGEGPARTHREGVTALDTLLPVGGFSGG